MADMHNARRVMVDNQIRTFDVTDRDVLAAFDIVPRELFVSDNDRAIAYADRAIALGGGRALLPPLLLARLVQALQPQAGERALDVLGGTGYSAAILAEIGLDVTVLESDAMLADKAKAALAAAGSAAKVAPVQADLGAGKVAAPAGGGFDIILINGATEREPKAFYPLLKDGGRLGVFVREAGACRALVYVKAGDHVSPRRAFDSLAPVLPGFAAEPGFVF